MLLGGFQELRVARLVDCVEGGCPQALGPSLEYNSALREPDDAIRKASREIDLVKAHDRSDTVLATYPVKVAQHPDGGFRVEARHRFVSENKLRLLGLGSCYANTLLLAAGELISAIESAVGESDAIERFERKDAIVAREWEHCSERSMSREASNQDVLERGKAPDEMVLLKDHPCASAVMTQCGSSREDRAELITNDIALRRPYEAIQRTQQCGLAGA